MDYFMNKSKYFEKDEKFKIIVSSASETSLHCHDFLEMAYVIEGSAYHTANNKSVVIKKNDYFIIDYGIEHKYDKINNENFKIINCLFIPDIIDKTLINCRSFRDLLSNYLIQFHYTSPDGSPVKNIFYDEDKSIYHLIQSLKSEYDKKKPGYIQLLRCYLIEIIILTMRKITNENIKESDDNISKYIIDYIEENYMNPITLSQISADLLYSLPYISQKFKKDVGLSYKQYLQRKRIEQSCVLLANTSKKIEEISELVGYSDIKFFNQTFKKHLKITPREFRKIHV